METKVFYYVLEIDIHYGYKEEIAKYQKKSDAVKYAKLIKKVYPSNHYRVVKITETIVFSTEQTESNE